MKKRIVSILLCGLLVISTGCSSGISQEDYDALQSEKAVLESEKSILESEKNEANQQIDSITKEFNTYKEKMKPYENLSIAEVEAKTAEEELKKKQAEEERKRMEESEAAAAAAESEAAAAAAAEEEAKGYETGITYEQLARTPDDYTGKKVKFSGKVVQILEGDDEIDMRLAVNSDYDDILYVVYTPSIVSSRVLEDDTITVYGTSYGLYSYESTLGGKITIPLVYVDRIDQ
ncbi:MAG: hypothetical protein ACI4CZ_06295 [Hominisplanchenecus sp.]